MLQIMAYFFQTQSSHVSSHIHPRSSAELCGMALAGRAGHSHTWFKCMQTL